VIIQIQKVSVSGSSLYLYISTVVVSVSESSLYLYISTIIVSVDDTDTETTTIEI
jgi:hypothetical protein